MKLTKYIPIIFLILLVVACGGTQEARTIQIYGLDGMKFAVKEKAENITVGDTLGKNTDYLLLESITVKPGEKVHIVLTTISTLPPVVMAHNWVLLAINTDAAAFAKAAIQAKDNDYIPQDMADQVLAETGLVAGGETKEVTFTAPGTPGEYDYICTFPAHFGAGMRGKVIVEGSTSPETTE